MIRTYTIKALGVRVRLCLSCRRVVMIITATIFWEYTIGQVLMNYTDTPHTLLGSPKSVYFLIENKGIVSKEEERTDHIKTEIMTLAQLMP